MENCPWTNGRSFKKKNVHPFLNRLVNPSTFTSMTCAVTRTCSSGTSALISTILQHGNIFNL